MGKIAWKGGALLAPVPPTLVTTAHGGRRNVFTVAWTGIINTVPPKTYISVRPSRLSHELIEASGGFVVNLPTEPLARAVDFCGVRSGREIDKFEAMQLAWEPSPLLGLPMLCDSPVCLECRVFEKRPLGSHDMFLADIAGVCVDERLLDSGGGLRLDRARLLAYAHGGYYGLGSRLGGFGFSVRKKKPAKKKAMRKK